MSTPTSPSGAGRPVGATPVGARQDDGRRKKGLLWGALALLALLALALLLSQCGGDDPAGGTDAAGGSDPAGRSSSSSESASESSAQTSESSPESSESSSSESGGSGGSGAGGGQLFAGSQDVLRIAAGGASGLAGLAGQTATATGVQVLSVPADEGFWVGSSETERIRVQLTGEPGESPYQVQEGDLVDFEGTVVAHDQAFPGEVGVDEANGAAQLTELGHHLEVAKNAVQFAE